MWDSTFMESWLKSIMPLTAGAFFIKPRYSKHFKVFALISYPLKLIKVQETRRNKYGLISMLFITIIYNYKLALQLRSRLHFNIPSESIRSRLNLHLLAHPFSL